MKKHKVTINNICNQVQIKTISDWITNFKKGDIKPLYLYSNNTTGKSTLANLILQKYNYTIIDFTNIYLNTHNNTHNISDTINLILCNKSIDMMFQKTNFKGLIIDNFEHFIDHEKSIYNDILVFLKNIEKYPNNPIIIISKKLNKKITDILNNICVSINIKYTKKKIKTIIENHLDLNNINLNLKTLNSLLDKHTYNLESIFEKISYIENSKQETINKETINKETINKETINKDTINDNNINYKFNKDIVYLNDNIFESIDYLFNLSFTNDKELINDLYVSINSDINILILTLLENSIKYIHTSAKKNYKTSISNICNIYNNIILSDLYENKKKSSLSDYTILQGIILPSYIISLGYKKNQFKFKETSLYSKSIIEIYNNKKKIFIENISDNLKNIDNIIKIYYNLSYNECKLKKKNKEESIKYKELLKYINNILNDDILSYSDIKKYIKYIITKCYNYKIK